MPQSTLFSLISVDTVLETKKQNLTYANGTTLVYFKQQQF